MGLVVAVGLSLGCATTEEPRLRGQSGGAELATSAGQGVASVLVTAVYAPVKLAYAVVGSLVGGLAYAFTGGDAAVAKPIVSRAVGGDYVVTTQHLQAPRTLAFIGRAAPTSLADASGGRGWVSGAKLPPVSAGVSRDCATLVENVGFQFGDARLNPSGVATLETVASSLRSCPNTRVDVVGHTDSTGNESGNRALAKRRADAVRNYLVAQDVDPDRLTVSAYGSERPSADNGTKEGRAANRRVELVAR